MGGRLPPMHKDKRLEGVERFTLGPVKQRKKYTAVLKDGRLVHFGHRDYQQYADSVPKSMGGGRYSHLDHRDEQRRQNYRRRHAGVRTASGQRAIDVQYSPAWFSYYFLW